VIRRLAWEVLRTGGAAPIRRVAAIAREHGLDARDRALLRRLVATEVRRRGTLQALVRRFARGRPSPELACFLRLGMVQLLFLDAVPDHAAVSETVRAAADALGLPKGRYVNAVLRAVAEARRAGSSGDLRRDLVGRAVHLAVPVFQDPLEHPLLWAEDALSIPAPLMKRWVKRMGREAAFEFATALLDEPPLSLRAVDVERDVIAAELLSSGV
jgi:16S rRNA (cytosine967-C5)-methyltransferase